jgi:hypothetical protein
MDEIANNRIDKFFDENEYDLEVRMAYEYMSDLNQKVYLYTVDLSQNKRDSLYNENESNEVYLNDPVELYALVDVLEPKNQSYNDDNTFRLKELGNLLVHVLIPELKFKNVRPKYGDYIVYMVDDGLKAPFPLVYQIADDSIKTFENVRSWGGYKAHFKTIICTPVDKNELKFEF